MNHMQRFLVCIRHLRNELVMKRWIACIVVCLSLQRATAQKTEFSIGVAGTVSFFRGPGAASTSSILVSDVPPYIRDVTINPFGNHPGFSGCAEATVQQISKKNFVAGLAIGYESLISRVKITALSTRLRTPADGTTELTNTFINLFPFVGKRLSSNKTNIDLSLGMDIGIPLSKHENGDALTNDGTIVMTDFNYQKPSIDLRPRLQLKLSRNHVGIQGNFSLGLTNYYSSGFSSDYKAYSNVFRLGIFYIL